MKRLLVFALLLLFVAASAQAITTNVLKVGGGYGGPDGAGATITTSGALSIDGALVVDGTSTLTGATTHTGATTVSLSTSATTGTTRALIGQVTAGTASMTTPLVTGVRGLVTLSGTTTGSGSNYFYGTQGKLAVTGTMNDGATWATGVFAQLDLSSGTYTSAQIAGLWIDMGAAANASAITGAPTMVDCIRVTCTPSGFKPKAILSVTANATYFLDLSVADGVAGWYASTSSGGGTRSYRLKVKIAGVDAYMSAYTD
jgi:hypothetical protein